MQTSSRGDRVFQNKRGHLLSPGAPTQLHLEKMKLIRESEASMTSGTMSEATGPTSKDALVKAQPLWGIQLLFPITLCCFSENE